MAPIDGKRSAVRSWCCCFLTAWLVVGCSSPLAKELPDSFEGAKRLVNSSRDRSSRYEEEVVQRMFFERILSSCLSANRSDRAPVLLILVIDVRGEVTRTYESISSPMSNCLARVSEKLTFPSPPYAPHFSLFEIYPDKPTKR